MLIGYVSDERYVAVADVLLEFERAGRTPPGSTPPGGSGGTGATIAVVRSTPRGAVQAEVEPGDYRVTLVKPGFGSKSVDVRIDEPSRHRPYQFRLLSDCLLGYVWPRWARSGERGEFRVHAVSPYRLTLWRYGMEKEQVKLLGWFDEHGPRATMQITPDGDYTQIGAQFNKRGYGSPHHTQTIAAPERSGLYYFHAEAEDGSFTAFPWVVAPAKPSAKLAVLASTNTWNAYNNFGGRSNYINAAGLPDVPVVNARLDMLRYQGSAFNEWAAPDDAYPPLSFERPEPHNFSPPQTRIADPIRGRMQCGLAPAEWRFFGWLERENIAYDLYADAHLHDGSLDLDAYKALAISVHPEYWSRAMYQRVKQWVFDRGGKLIYLGGNGINCEVELNNDGTMRCKTQLLGPAGTLAPVDPTTGKTCDSRFARTVESEANLLGVVTTDSGIMTAAPYRVIEPNHWILDGTGLAKGDCFGEASLHERIFGGASGHETDKRSTHSPATTVLLAKGENPDDGGGEMVYHETAGGGAVFSVGSITWVASLWVDPIVSRITANVVRRFLSS